MKVSSQGDPGSMYGVFTPTLARHSLNAVATHAGPLSERI